MGFEFGIKDILVAGGPTLALLILLSVYSVALIWERWRFYRRTTASLPAFLAEFRRILASGDLSRATAACRSHPGPVADVLMAALVGSTSREERQRAAQRAIERAVAQLERRLAVLATIGSIAPFIGLFGTVVGVMRAFKDLASAAGAGPGVVAIGISEALICTAAGLFVAIPAVAAYNYFNERTGRFADEMGWICDEVLESLSHTGRHPHSAVRP